MKQLKQCVAASLIFGLLAASATADDDDKKKPVKKNEVKAAHAIVIASGDGQETKTIRVEGKSLEEVHRLLQEKLKDFPADVRKKVEAGLKKAHTHELHIRKHGDQKDNDQDLDVAGNRIQIRSLADPKSNKKAGEDIEIKGIVIKGGPDFKLDGDAKNIRVRIIKSDDGSVKVLRDGHDAKDVHVEVEVEDDGDGKTQKRVERRIRVRKKDGDDDHKDGHEERRIRVEVDGDHKDGKKIERRIRVEIDSDDDGDHEGEHKGEHGDVKKGERRIMLRLNKDDLVKEDFLKELPKEVREKLHAHLKELGGKIDGKRVQLFMLKDGTGAGEQKWTDKAPQIKLDGNSFQWKSADGKKDAPREFRVTSGSSSDVNKRLDKIEGELKVIRKLLEKISKE